MRRDHALDILKEHVTDELVVAVYQALFDWMALNPRDLNYVSTGAMGRQCVCTLRSPQPSQTA